MITFMLYLAAAAVGGGQSISADRLREVAAQERFDNSRSEFGWSATPAPNRGGDSYVVSLYPARFNTEDGGRRMVARRAMLLGGREAVQWADSRSCPALLGVTWGLSRLTLPSLAIPGAVTIRPETGSPEISGAVGTVRYLLWGRGLQPDNRPADVTASATDGLIADWATAAERSLEPCWQTARPSSRSG